MRKGKGVSRTLRIFPGRVILHCRMNRSKMSAHLFWLDSSRWFRMPLPLYKLSAATQLRCQSNSRLRFRRQNHILRKTTTNCLKSGELIIFGTRVKCRKYRRRVFQACEDFCFSILVWTVEIASVDVKRSMRFQSHENGDIRKRISVDGLQVCL